eukprot:g1810.t1
MEDDPWLAGGNSLQQMWQTMMGYGPGDEDDGSLTDAEKRIYGDAFERIVRRPAPSGKAEATVFFLHALGGGDARDPTVDIFAQVFAHENNPNIKIVAPVAPKNKHTFEFPASPRTSARDGSSMTMALSYPRKANDYCGLPRGDSSAIRQRQADYERAVTATGGAVGPSWYEYINYDTVGGCDTRDISFPDVAIASDAIRLLIANEGEGRLGNILAGVSQGAVLALHVGFSSYWDPPANLKAVIAYHAVTHRRTALDYLKPSYDAGVSQMDRQEAEYERELAEWEATAAELQKIDELQAAAACQAGEAASAAAAATSTSSCSSSGRRGTTCRGSSSTTTKNALLARATATGGTGAMTTDGQVAMDVDPPEEAHSASADPPHLGADPSSRADGGGDDESPFGLRSKASPRKAPAISQLGSCGGASSSSNVGDEPERWGFLQPASGVPGNDVLTHTLTLKNMDEEQESHEHGAEMQENVPFIRRDESMRSVRSAESILVDAAVPVDMPIDKVGSCVGGGMIHDQPVEQVVGTDPAVAAAATTYTKLADSSVTGFKPSTTAGTSSSAPGGSSVTEFVRKLKRPLLGPKPAPPPPRKRHNGVELRLVCSDQDRIFNAGPTRIARDDEPEPFFFGPDRVFPSTPLSNFQRKYPRRCPGVHARTDILFTEYVKHFDVDASGNELWKPARDRVSLGWSRSAQAPRLEEVTRRAPDRWLKVTHQERKGHADRNHPEFIALQVLNVVDVLRKEAAAEAAGRGSGASGSGVAMTSETGGQATQDDRPEVERNEQGQRKPSRMCPDLSELCEKRKHT